MKELNENTLKNYKSGPLYARVRDLLIDYIAELPPEKEYLPYEYEMEESLKVSRQKTRMFFWHQSRKKQFLMQKMCSNQFLMVSDTSVLLSNFLD